MTVKNPKILIKALSGEKTERPPFWFMRQAGRFLPEYRKVRAEMDGFWDLVFTPEKAARVTIQPVERFGMDAAILFSDILVIPYALGQDVKFVEGTGPVLGKLDFDAPGFGLDDSEGIEALSPIFETLRLTRAELPGEVTLIGFAGSPWTVATYMVEGKGTPKKQGTIDFANTDPEKFQHLVDVIVKNTVDYLLRQIEAGAEALQLFDSWAEALTSEDMFRRWSIEPTRQIVAAVKAKAPHIPIIGFPRGAGDKYRIYFEETGVDALSIDYDVDPDWAAKELQPLGCVQGNLDPMLLVEGGGKMMDQVAKIVTAFEKGPHVFNLGHGIVPQTPPENVMTVVEYLKAKGKK